MPLAVFRVTEEECEDGDLKDIALAGWGQGDDFGYSLMRSPGPTSPRLTQNAESKRH
jgi:hypothetical protein